ncbi:MAG: hypothetical protein ABSG32_18890 [Terriglobia bacterium]|jgi:hypothetical protein
MFRRTHLESKLLDEIVNYYLKSADFNGIPLHLLLKNQEPESIDALKRLVRNGLVEVISDAWDNPCIKRLRGREITKQIEVLEIQPAARAFLYPTKKHMKTVIHPRLYQDRPFTRLLALANPQIEPMFFDLSVLDRYQSDPRYIFQFDGLDGRVSITDRHYQSRSMGSSDKVILKSFGLGADAKGQRVAVVFLRYLSGLTPRHQQYWRSHQIGRKCRVESNYLRRSLFGKWTDGISVYEAFRAELFHINKMCGLIGLPMLFRKDFSDEPPKGFGLLIRPTQQGYFEFAHTLDKLISENLNLRFFEAEGLSLEEQKAREDGTVEVIRKGTLRLLEEWLTRRIRFEVQGGPSKILSPLRLVRRLRQEPAHEVLADEFSTNYQRKKEKLIHDVYFSISNIRIIFQTHPLTGNYRFPERLKLENLVLY